MIKGITIYNVLCLWVGRGKQLTLYIESDKHYWRSKSGGVD
jgi:hypothetical protein